jgi:hypothetical protein
MEAPAPAGGASGEPEGQRPTRQDVPDPRIEEYAIVDLEQLDDIAHADVQELGIADSVGIFCHDGAHVLPAALDLVERTLLCDVGAERVRRVLRWERWDGHHGPSVRLGPDKPGPEARLRSSSSRDYDATSTYLSVARSPAKPLEQFLGPNGLTAFNLGDRIEQFAFFLRCRLEMACSHRPR